MRTAVDDSRPLESSQSATFAVAKSGATEGDTGDLALSFDIPSQDSSGFYAPSPGTLLPITVPDDHRIGFIAPIPAVFSNALRTDAAVIDSSADAAARLEYLQGRFAARIEEASDRLFDPAVHWLDATEDSDRLFKLYFGKHAYILHNLHAQQSADEE